MRLPAATSLKLGAKHRTAQHRHRALAVDYGGHAQLLVGVARLAKAGDVGASRSPSAGCREELARCKDGRYDSGGGAEKPASIPLRFYSHSCVLLGVSLTSSDCGLKLDFNNAHLGNWSAYHHVDDANYAESLQSVL